MTLLLDPVVIRDLRRIEYSRALQEMRGFTAARDASTPDELWLVEHPPVYTLGQGADEAAPGNAVAVVVLCVGRSDT